MVNLYTPLEEAKEEIWRRWNDETLKKEVEEYIGEIPESLRYEPRTVLVRTIVTPDNEFFHFIEAAKQIEFKPLVFEYINDKFCTKNNDKLRLAKMPFFIGRNKKGDAIIKNHTVLDCAHADGKQCNKVQTLWGEKFVEFHHRLFSFNTTDIEIFDASLWFMTNGKSAKQYYQNFLSLFVCNGILFENFLMDEREGRFTSEVVIPAFEKVQTYFGAKPLIVPAIPEDEIDDIYWWCYPEWVEKEVERCLSQTTKKP